MSLGLLIDRDRVTREDMSQYVARICHNFVWIRIGLKTQFCVNSAFII